MDVFIISTIPLLIYFIVRLAGLVIVLIKNGNNNDVTDDLEVDCKILRILLPAFEESEIVQETLDWYKSIVTGTNIKVYVILSNEEGIKTTESEFNKWLLHNPDFDGKFSKIFDSHGMTKQSKLNYAVETISQEENFLNDDWLYIADFDARPPKSSFSEFYSVSKKEGVRVIQQVPTLRPVGPKFVPHVLSLEHLSRVIFVEILLDRLLKSTFNPFKSRLWSCMGASLFIRYDALSLVGGFPEQSDDIALGYQLSLHSLKKTNIYQLTHVEPPNDIHSLLKQYTRIYSGVFSIDEAIQRTFPNGYLFLKRIKHKFSTYFVDFISLIMFSYFIFMTMAYITLGLTIEAQNFFALYIISEVIISIFIVQFSFGYYKHWKIMSVIFYMVTSPFLSALKTLGCLIYYHVSRDNLIEKSFSTKRAPR